MCKCVCLCVGLIKRKHLVKRKQNGNMMMMMIGTLIFFCIRLECASECLH
jgi:hypothetical protein